VSLIIGIQQSADGPLLERIALNETVVLFDDEENGGYYRYLYPTLLEAADATGQMIDLNGYAMLRGEQLSVLRLALVKARLSTEDQPNRWPVSVGTSSMPNATPPQPPQVVWKEVEKAKLLALLDRLMEIIDRAASIDGTVLYIGD